MGAFDMLDRFREVFAPTKPDLAKMRERIFRQAPQVVWTTHLGETVVFDIDRGKYELLNEVATSVWEQVIRGATLQQIVEAIQDQYELPADGSADELINDIVEVLTHLERARIVESEPMTRASANVTAGR